MKKLMLVGNADGRSGICLARTGAALSATALLAASRLAAT